MADDGVLLAFKRFLLDLPLEEIVDGAFAIQQVGRFFKLWLVFRQFLSEHLDHVCTRLILI